MAINDNTQNCYPYTPYTVSPTYTWFNVNPVDHYKIEAMKLALGAKSGCSFKEIAKLAAQIEEYLRA